MVRRFFYAISIVGIATIKLAFHLVYHLNCCHCWLKQLRSYEVFLIIYKSKLRL